MKSLIVFTLLALALVASAGAATVEHIYWTEWRSYQADESFIARALPDGTAEEILLDGFTDGTGVKDMAIDQGAGKLYFANRSAGLIERCNLDGTARDTVLAGYNPIGLAVDPDGGKIYWTDYTYNDPTIRRADLDGTDAEVLYECSDGCVLEGIALDPAGGFLYWAERMDQQIYRGYMAGGWSARILHCADGIGHPCGLAYHQGRIYWGGGDLIGSATELGDDVQILLEGLDHNPRSLELDPVGGRIYWSTATSYGGVVQSATMSGGDLQTHIEGLQWGYGLALELGEPVPVLDVPRPGLDLSCRPNPFNPGTTLGYELAEAAPVRLQIHALDGALVAELAHGWREAGRHRVRWDGRDTSGRALPSGVYLGHLVVGTRQTTQRLTLVR